jgi:hypothetical protein
VVVDALKRLGDGQADCILPHAPYFNFNRSNEDPRDPCNAPDLPTCLGHFRVVVANAWTVLRPGRFMALFVGDAFTKGEWVPLDLECMQVCRKVRFRLKAINVKDIQGNKRAKGKSKNLCRCRALRQGFYVFKHEYVMVFWKPD